MGKRSPTNLLLYALAFSRTRRSNSRCSLAGRGSGPGLEMKPPPSSLLLLRMLDVVDRFLRSGKRAREALGADRSGGRIDLYRPELVLLKFCLIGVASMVIEYVFV